MSRTPTIRTVPLVELKAINDTPGLIRGRASVYGVVDSYGDDVRPGAFTKTLQEKRGVVVVLSQHDPAQSIGRATLTDQVDGLHCDIRLALEIPKAAEEYARVKAGLIDGISIGYETVREQHKNGVRQLLELRLWEVSLVTFPANSEARITAVKHHASHDQLSELRAAAERLGTVAYLTRAAGTLRDTTDAIKRTITRNRR